MAPLSGPVSEASGSNGESVMTGSDGGGVPSLSVIVIVALLGEPMS